MSIRFTPHAEWNLQAFEHKFWQRFISQGNRYKAGSNYILGQLRTVYDHYVSKPVWGDSTDQLKLKKSLAYIANASGGLIAVVPGSEPPAAEPTWMNEVVAAFKDANIHPDELDNCFKTALFIARGLGGILKIDAFYGQGKGKRYQTAQAQEIKDNMARELNKRTEMERALIQIQQELGDLRLEVPGALRNALKHGNIDLLLQVLERPWFELPEAPWITFDAAKKRRQDAVVKIFAEFQRLRKILWMHGPQIAEIWKEKEDDRRRETLQKSWGNINVHREAFEAVLNLEPHKAKEEAYKWPHLNLVDLVQRNSFLILLNSRAQNNPRDFVYLDHDSWQLGRDIGQIRVPFLHDVVMDFRDISGSLRDQEKTYGQLIEKVSSNLDLRMKEVGLYGLPLSGLITLEIQSHTYKFLADVCQDLLSISDEDVAKIGRPPNLSKKRPPIPKECLERQSMTDEPLIDHELAKIRYGLPDSDIGKVPKLDSDFEDTLKPDSDLRNVLNVMDALIESQESYLRALRRDPVSFTQALRLYQECCSKFNEISIDAGVIKLNNKKDEEIYNNNNKKNGLEILLVSEFTLLDILIRLQDSLKELEESLKDPENKIAPFQHLPDKVRIPYIKIIRYSRHLVETTNIPRLDGLVGAFQKLGHKLDIFKLEDRFDKRKYIDIKKEFRPDYLLSLLLTMVSFHKPTTGFIRQYLSRSLGLSACSKELQRLMQENPADFECFPTIGKQRLSDMAVIAYLPQLVSHHFPWLIHCWVEIDLEAPAFVNEERAAIQSTLEHLYKRVIQGVSKRLLKHAEAIQNEKSYFPFNARNKEHVERRRNAELNLSRMWELFDDACKKNNILFEKGDEINAGGIGLSNKLQEIFHKPSTPSTPNWVRDEDLPPPKSPKGDDEIEPSSAAAEETALVDPLNENGKRPHVETDGNEEKPSQSSQQQPQQPERPPTKKKRAAAAEKTKEKTKGKADPSKDKKRKQGTQEEEEDLEAEEPDVTYYLSKRGLAALESIYPTKQDLAAYGRGTVDWNSFTTALADLGFVLDNVNGSTYHFRAPERWRKLAYGNKTFHHPHSTGKQNMEDNLLQVWADELRDFPIEEELRKGLYEVKRRRLG